MEAGFGVKSSDAKTRLSQIEKQSDLEWSCRHSNAAAGTADDRHGAGVRRAAGHHGATVAAAAAVLPFTRVASIRAVGIEMCRYVRTARLDQHLAGGRVIIALADLDCIHFDGAAAGTAATGRKCRGRNQTRSEERRVGKEGRSPWSADH